jgi:uronate dehydrogenase
MTGLQEANKYEVLGGDINPNSTPNSNYLDVADFNKCCELMEGVNTVVHLAYELNSSDLTEVLKVNYLGMCNIYEAAKVMGVKRVIFGSSNHTVGLYTSEEEVTVDTPYKPDSLYALSKCHGELLGRLYADKFSISSINIRIGTFSERPPKTGRQLRTWISGRDMIQLTKCCIEASEQFRYLNLFGISNNQNKYWDIAYLESLIGYKPEDDGGAHLQDSTVFDAEELFYQGGTSAFRKSI